MTKPEPSPAVSQHRREAPRSVSCAVLTLSDTRTAENDASGQEIVDGLTSAGHRVIERLLIPDDPRQVREIVSRWSDEPSVDAVLITGGTGIAPRDHTPDVLAELFTRPLPGYGELLRMLSYQEIGSAAMLSRACGGLVESTVVLAMPGSTAAVRLAMEKIILPELAHLVGLSQK